MRAALCLIAAFACIAAAPAFAQLKPIAPPAATSAPAVGSGGLIDINSASVEALDTLPGIGDARAKAIVAGRPYTDKADLVTKKILPQNVFDGLKDKIALANINTASAKDLAATLPGVGDARSAAIVKGRPYTSAQDLVKKNILPQPVFDKVKGLVTTK
jgi:competence protein ComEA